MARTLRQLVLILRHEKSPALQVVLPDEVPEHEGPWLRPTHTAGLPTPPQVDVTPLIAHHLAKPRTSEDTPAVQPRA